MILGLVLILFHVCFWKYCETRKILYLIMALAGLVAAALSSSVGIGMAVISVLSVAAAFGIDHIALKLKESGSYERVSNISVVILAVVISFAILALLLLQFLGAIDSYKIDITNTYLKNLYGTTRFSVLPFIDICVMHFVYIHVLLYLWLSKKIQKHRNLFLGISFSFVLYIIMIGAMYVLKWANENMNAYGEYMTGFGQHMMVVAVLIYCYWIYVGIISITITRKS